MNILKFWLNEFRDGFLFFFGMIFLVTLLIRLVNPVFLDIDKYYSHPPLEDVLTLAAWLALIFATLSTTYTFYFAKSYEHKKT